MMDKPLTDAETRNKAMLEALISQRDAAMNECVNKAAEIASLRAKLKEAEGAIAALQELRSESAQ